MGIPLQTMFMTWIKTTKGKIKADRLGFYTRQSCEYVLMGSRGNVLKYKNPNRVVEVTRIPLSSILVTGIQGSGKTTTSGKLASYLTNQSYKVLLVSLDTARPAAQEQLEILAHQTVGGWWIEKRSDVSASCGFIDCEEWRILFEETN
jgi:signal recognition particle GTPase